MSSSGYGWVSMDSSSMSGCFGNDGPYDRPINTDILVIVNRWSQYINPGSYNVCYFIGGASSSMRAVCDDYGSLRCIDQYDDSHKFHRTSTGE